MTTKLGWGGGRGWTWPSFPKGQFESLREEGSSFILPRLRFHSSFLFLSEEEKYTHISSLLTYFLRVCFFTHKLVLSLSFFVRSLPPQLLIRLSFVFDQRTVHPE